MTTKCKYCLKTIGEDGYCTCRMGRLLKMIAELKAKKTE